MAAPQWTFSEDTIRFDFQKGDLILPPGQLVNVSHPADFDGEGDYTVVYTNFEIEYLPTGFTGGWLDVAPNPDEENLNNGLDLNILLSVDNTVNGFDASTRIARLKFETIGFISTPLTEDVLATGYIDVELYVSDFLGIETSPALIELEHYKTNPLQFPKQFTIEAVQAWTISYPDILVISTDSPNATPPIGTSIKSITGGGNATFNISLSPQVDGQPVGLQTKYITISPADGVRQIPVLIDIKEVVDFYGYPYSFLFETILNIAAAQQQYLFIDINDSFTIQKPAWLDVFPGSGDAGQLSFYVRPIVDENTVEGTITGDIEIITDNTLETYTIPVTHVVNEFVGPIGDLNYTRDVKYIDVFAEEDNTYFTITLTTRVFDRVSHVPTQYVFSYKLPLFNLKQKKNIGLIVDRLIKGYELNGLETQSYLSTEVDVLIQELKIDDETVLNNAGQNNIRYIAGFTPHKTIDECSILTRNQNAKRITTNSFSYLNLYLTLAVYELNIYQNNTLIDTINIDAFTYDLHSILLDWSQYELKKGDVVQVKIEINPGEFLVESYLVFPDNKHSQFIVWEDEYKMRQCLEFTGDYSLQTAKEQITHKYQTNLLERLQKYRVQHTLKLIMDTGWVLESDQITVDNLTDAKKAWLILGDDKDVFVEVIPVNQNINNIDSDRELISFEVEFELNKESHAKIYNF